MADDDATHPLSQPVADSDSDAVSGGQHHDNTLEICCVLLCVITGSLALLTLAFTIAVAVQDSQTPAGLVNEMGMGIVLGAVACFWLSVISVASGLFAKRIMRKKK